MIAPPGLAPGARLPPLALPATDGGMIDIAALPGRSLVMVYPWTGRPGRPNPPNWDEIQGAHGSTPELEGFRDRHADFRASRHKPVRSEPSDHRLSARAGGAACASISDLERCGRPLRRRAPAAELHHWRRDLSQAPHPCGEGRANREGVLSRRPTRRVTPPKCCLACAGSLRAHSSSASSTE